MIHILTNTETILKTEVRPQESRIGDENVKGVLSLRLKQALTNTSFTEQQCYLQSSATAAYVSLNKLDQRSRFRASVNLIACNNVTFNFSQGSSSSGLGYALACFDAWWRLGLNKSSHFQLPIFATGEVLTSGQINPIAQITEKIESVCRYVEENIQTISSFHFCYPVDNDVEIPQTLKERLLGLGGQLVPSNRLQHTLGVLLGKAYDGDPLGRWIPFKGLSSFDYEDSVRFFGREKDVERIYNDIEHNNGLLIVSGASGTGKSSLIKAGLIPKLEKEYGYLYWASCTPNTLNSSQGILTFILEQLIKAWDIQCKDVEEVISIFDLSVDDGVEFFRNQVNNKSNKCLLYLDQFEEVFSKSELNNNVVANQLSVIDSLAKSLAPLSVVLALRNEYLGRLLDSQALRSPIISNVASKLTYQEWQSIVHDQALFSGINFELSESGKQSLDTVIVEEAIQIPFALPMVSFLLEQLYVKALEEDCSATTLLYKHYHDLGGLAGAIAYRASKVIQDYNPSEKLMSKFFDCFVGINPEGLPYARHVALIEIEQTDNELYALVVAFIDSNLVANVTNESHETLVKLAHDSLFSRWDHLKEWIESCKEYLIWRYSVEGSFIRWQKNLINKKDHLIKDGHLLKEGKRYQKSSHIVDKKLDTYLCLSIRHKNQRKFNFFITLFVLPLILFSVYQWDKGRIKTYYYSAIGEKWSIPFGINELSDEEVKHRTFSYRLDFQGGMLRRLAYVNSKDALVKDASRGNNALWVYKYTAERELLSESIQDEKEKVFVINHYQFDKTNSAVLTFGIKVKNVGFLKNNLSLLSQYAQLNQKKRNTTVISRVLLKYKKNGSLEKKSYQNPYGVLIPDGENSFGKIFTYNSQGLIELESNLDQDGNASVNDGVTKIKFEYDLFGNVIKQSYYGYDENLIVINEGYAFQIMNYDSWGNLVSGMLYDHKLRPSTHLEGLSSYSQKVDDKGNVSETKFFDTKGNLALRKQGVAIIRYLYDENGNEIEQSYFGINNEPVVANDSLGYSRGVTRYDNNNNVIQNLYYGIDGSLTKVKGGFAKRQYKYDQFNRLISISNFGENEKLILNDLEWATEKGSYDKNDNVAELSYYGLENEPILMSMGMHKQKMAYDSRKNPVEVSFFDINDKLIKTKPPSDSAAKTIFQYDERNNKIKSAFYGVDGKPILNRFSCSIMETKIDVSGKRTSLTCRGINDQPVLDIRGVHKEVRNYDKNGVLIGISNFGIDLKPITSKYGFSKIEFDLNKSANEVNVFNSEGRNFQEDNLSLFRKIMTKFSVEVSESKASLLTERRSNYLSFDENSKSKDLQGTSVYRDKNDDFFLLSLENHNIKGNFNITLRAFINCNLQAAYPIKTIKVNSNYLRFSTYCIKAINNQIMFIFVHMSKKGNNEIISELLSKREISFSYDNRVLNFMTKGFATVYIKHRLNN